MYAFTSSWLKCVNTVVGGAIFNNFTIAAIPHIIHKRKIT